MSTSVCWELTCDGLVSNPGGVKYSHPLKSTETGDKRQLHICHLSRMGFSFFWAPQMTYCFYRFIWFNFLNWLLWYKLYNSVMAVFETQIVKVNFVTSQVWFSMTNRLNILFIPQFLVIANFKKSVFYILQSESVLCCNKPLHYLRLKFFYGKLTIDAKLFNRKVQLTLFLVFVSNFLSYNFELLCKNVFVLG